MLETETGLMNYRPDRCMSAESKMFEIGQINELLT